MIKKIILFFICIIWMRSQTLSPVVINAAGGSYTLPATSGLMIYSDNIGETFVSTISNGNIILTQGFLQPESRLAPSLIFTVSHVTCLDKSNGFIQIEVINAGPGSTFTTQWYPPGLCSNLNCFVLDSLSAGNFSVLVTVNDGYTVYPLQASFTINDSQEPCAIKIFNGVTLNGNNNFLYIENIEQYPNNTISFYSRWGNHLATIEGYNNRDKKWPMNKNYSAGTYYYILTLKNGAKPVKGWLELID